MSNNNEPQVKVISKWARKKNGQQLKQVVIITEAGYKKNEKKKYTSKTRHIPV